MKKYKFTYEKSGVNINAADIFVKYIANLNKKKKSAIKNNNIGSFASVTSIPKGLKKPLLISSTDGVGTKIEIANKTIGKASKLIGKSRQKPGARIDFKNCILCNFILNRYIC